MPFITITQRVFTSPNALFTMYVGIIPPLKNMLTIMSISIYDPNSVRLDMQYAAIAEHTILRMHPAPT